MGDLQGLADNISRLTLLQPIGITPEGELVYGARRLISVRDILHWTEIPAHISTCT